MWRTPSMLVCWMIAGALSCQREPLREVMVEVSMPLQLNGSAGYVIEVYRLDGDAATDMRQRTASPANGAPLSPTNPATHGVVLAAPTASSQLDVIVYVSSDLSTRNEAVVTLEPDRVALLPMPMVRGCSDCPSHSCSGVDAMGAVVCRERVQTALATYCPDGGVCH